MDKSNSVLRSVKATVAYLTGDPSDFALESRIFNSLCLIALVAIAYHIPFNFIIGLPVSGIIAIILLVVQSCLYYLSRFKRKPQISILLSGITIHILFIVNYFFNAGIGGPTLILLALSFFLIITIAPKRFNHIWLFSNLAIVFGLLAVEYYYPDFVMITYAARVNMFIDIGSAYLVTIVLVYTGITHIRNSYNKEKRSAEMRAVSMEHLNDEKDKLFSIISHDLRAPLSTIQDYLQLLSTEDLSPEERQQFKKELLQITQSTQDMLSNILTWSTSQMSGIKAQISEINILKVLYPTLSVQRAIAMKKNLEFDFSIDPSLEILADPDLLQVIIRNLINNSIKFTQPGGKIYVECREQSSECLFIVKDTGIGIPASKASEIFSLKANPTYGTQNEKGVGLGLLLCNEFTAAQNGKIWMKSKEGEGTVFYISFPIKKTGV